MSRRILHPVQAKVSATSRRTQGPVHLAEPGEDTAICGFPATFGFTLVSPLGWGILSGSLCGDCHEQTDPDDTVEPA